MHDSVYRRGGFIGALAALVIVGAATSSPASERPLRLPAPQADVAPGGETHALVLAGGCFWGLQGIFEHVKGVRRVVAGYSGGEAGTARYEEVGSGTTGHAESVRIEYDPRAISYGQLL